MLLLFELQVFILIKNIKMSRRRTQKSLSQRKTSTPMEVDDDDDVAQSSQNASLTDQEHMHHVSNVVKYILAADQSKVPIVRTKISEAVNCRNKAFRPVMDSAAKTLLDVSRVLKIL